MKKNFKKIMVLIFIFCNMMLTIPQQVRAAEKVKVLFISSYNTTFISFSDQIQGIKIGFDGNVEIQTEYLDSNSARSQKGEENFYNLLKYKLNTYDDFDAIILADTQALNFGVKYRNDLFKDIPVVFMGVGNEESIKKALELDLVSGVKEENSLEENVDLITRLHRKVKNITFINDGVNKQIEESYQKCINKYPHINFKILLSGHMDYEDFKEELIKFDKDDAVVMIYPNTFKDGKTISTTEAVELTTEHINSPIYSVVNYGVGDGFLGGKVVSHVEQGKKAVEIVKGILNGEDAKKLYVGDDSANQYLFDYNILNKYNIDKNDLPEGSLILNEPMPFFEKYKGVIIPGLMIIFSLIIAIIALILYSVKVTNNEKELIKAKKEAEEANKAKGNFISNINHELRTPVAVIMAANKLVRLKSMEYENESLTGNLDVINQNCYRLLRLINNIIDIAKVDSGFNELTLQNMNIVELLEKIVLSVVPYAKEKNIDIIFDTTEEELIMAVDPNKIERIVLNLLSNAIKFSKENGCILADVIVESDKIIFSIADNGIGIDEDNLQKIFNKFTQVDNTFTRANEGSGIGLSLVKSFVEMHKGQVIVQSKLGEGTKFIVELPVHVMENCEGENLEITSEEPTIIRTKVEFSDIYL